MVSEKAILEALAPQPADGKTEGPRRRGRTLDRSFLKASAEARGFIRRDAERFAGDPRAVECLKLLERRLFDRGFDVRAWKRRGKISRGTADRIAAELGPLKAYLDKHRVRAAERLIRETDAPLPEIGRRVGFTVPKTFRRTFRRILGMTPHEMRLSCLEPPPEAAGPPAGTEDGDLSPAARAAAWRRRITLCFAGQRQLFELRGELRRLYPRPGPVGGQRWSMRPAVEVGADDYPFTSNELRDAARPVALAIVYDEKRSPRKLRPLFRELRKHLFRASLTLDSIRRQARAGERSIWTSFRHAVGRPPWTYIREARMEMAAILLAHTSLSVKHVAAAVGYTSRAAFGRAFADFAGEPPADYRVRFRRLQPRLGIPPRDLEDPGFWEAALAGSLDGEEAWELEDYVARYLSVVRSACADNRRGRTPCAPT